MGVFLAGIALSQHRSYARKNCVYTRFLLARKDRRLPQVFVGSFENFLQDKELS